MKSVLIKSNFFVTVNRISNVLSLRRTLVLFINIDHFARFLSLMNNSYL